MGLASMRFETCAHEGSHLTDLGERPEAEQEAIVGLAQAGVVQSSDDGLFHPDSPLTPQDESLILTRLAEAVRP